MQSAQTTTASIHYSILLLGLTYALIGRYGLIGAGWAWVATYAIMAVIMAANAKREGAGVKNIVFRGDWSIL